MRIYPDICMLITLAASQLFPGPRSIFSRFTLRTCSTPIGYSDPHSQAAFPRMDEILQSVIGVLSSVRRVTICRGLPERFACVSPAVTVSRVHKSGHVRIGNHTALTSSEHRLMSFLGVGVVVEG